MVTSIADKTHARDNHFCSQSVSNPAEPNREVPKTPLKTGFPSAGHGFS
jgi:hypothetical protein